MHLYSMPMELICIMSTTILLVHSLPLTGLPRNWIPGTDESENYASSSFYDSLLRPFASKSLLSLGSKASNPPLLNDVMSYPLQRQFHSLNNNLVEFSKPKAKRQQGWYNPYGKRGYEPVPPMSSKIWSPSDYLDQRVMPTLYYPSEHRAHHQDSGVMQSSKSDNVFGTTMKDSARRKESGEISDVLSSANDSSYVMTQELAELKQKLRKLYRTFATDIRSMGEAKEIVHDVDYNPWLDKLNRVQQFESS